MYNRRIHERSIRMDGNLRELGQRIKQARRKQGLDQAGLAEKLNISVSHMSDIENGRTNFSIEIFMRLTEALQVSADVLLRTDVPEVAAVYASEIRELMEDCTPDEQDAMVQTLRNMKTVFLKNRK